MSLCPRLVALPCLTLPLLAQGDQQVTSFPLAVSKFALHHSEPLLYASVPALNAVAVVNTQTLELEATPFVGSNPRGLAVSPDGGTLWIATAGATQLARLDTATLQPLPPVVLPTLPSDVEIGANGIAYVTPTGQSMGILMVDTVQAQYLGEFSFGVSVYSAGMLEISPDRNTLYFANVGLSPGTLAAFDVSTATPALLYKNNHGALGSNGQDLALSTDGTFVSYACGGGNFNYDIFKISTANYAVQGSFLTGAYPREIAFDPAGARAFAVHTAGEIDVFSTQTFLHLREIDTVGEARELIVDATGRFLFAAFDASLVVWDLAEAPGTSFCGGASAACPCANGSGPVQGCTNSGASGALLVAAGSTSLAADDLGLDAALLPPLKSAVLVAGTAPAGPIALGDGSLCVGGLVTRLAPGVSDAQGDLGFGPGLDLSALYAAGQTGYLQAWYRDAGGPCGSSSNLTNGVQVLFTP